MNNFLLHRQPTFRIGGTLFEYKITSSESAKPAFALEAHRIDPPMLFDLYIIA